MTSTDTEQTNLLILFMFGELNWLLKHFIGNSCGTVECFVWHSLATISQSWFDVPLSIRTGFDIALSPPVEIWHRVPQSFRIWSDISLPPSVSQSIMLWHEVALRPWIMIWIRLATISQPYIDFTLQSPVKHHFSRLPWCGELLYAAMHMVAHSRPLLIVVWEWHIGLSLLSGCSGALEYPTTNYWGPINESFLSSYCFATIFYLTINVYHRASRHQFAYPHPHAQKRKEKTYVWDNFLDQGL